MALVAGVWITMATKLAIVLGLLILVLSVSCSFDNTSDSENIKKVEEKGKTSYKKNDLWLVIGVFLAVMLIYAFSAAIKNSRFFNICRNRAHTCCSAIRCRASAIPE